MHSGSARSSLWPGMLCGIGAGALWGLVFLAPEFARAFSPLELTIGRYLAYGVIALVLIAPRWSRLVRQLERRDWWMLAGLALTGNTLYYVLVVNAVQLGGIAMTSLIVGFVPVAVTIIGSRAMGAVPLSALAPSLLLCAAGAIAIGWQALVAPGQGTRGAQVIGLLAAVGALISWTILAVGNARWLARLRSVSSQEWNLLLGLVTGAQAVMLLPLALYWHDGGVPRDWGTFAIVSIGVAVFASILGNLLWNQASRLLPLTLVGQMILFETAFALVYAFIWEARWPTMMEAVAFALVVASVITCVAAHRRHRPVTALAAS